MEAKVLDLDKPLLTKGGSAVRLLGVLRGEGLPYHLLIAVENSEGDGTYETFVQVTAEGKLWEHDPEPFVFNEKEFIFNVYPAHGVLEQRSEESASREKNSKVPGMTLGVVISQSGVPEIRVISAWRMP